ncbi:MAG: mechanosensitive ion channel domain-containing protein [Prochlorothrix sp.]|nr:mechanosensitive ion channel domain-containing protein [Prochlorothrix sp.]
MFHRWVIPFFVVFGCSFGVAVLPLGVPLLAQSASPSPTPIVTSSPVISPRLEPGSDSAANSGDPALSAPDSGSGVPITAPAVPLTPPIESTGSFPQPAVAPSPAIAPALVPDPAPPSGSDSGSSSNSGPDLNSNPDLGSNSGSSSSSILEDANTSPTDPTTDSNSGPDSNPVLTPPPQAPASSFFPPPVTSSPAPEQKIDGFPVVLGSEELFRIQADVASFSAQERAATVTSRLRAIADDPDLDPKQLQMEVNSEAAMASLILANRVIVTLTAADAYAARQSQEDLAQTYRMQMIEAIEQYRLDRSPRRLALGGALALASTLVLLVVMNLLNQLKPRCRDTLDRWRTSRIPPLRIQNLELLPATRVTDILIGSVDLVYWGIVLGLLYVYTFIVLGFFPWTRRLGNFLSQYLVAAYRHFWVSFLNYLPNLFTIILIIVITYYSVKLCHLIFQELETGAITIPGFYQDWAQPTYRLTVLLIVALAAVIIFPYLPGFDSPAFQGVSLFLGVLFSLGSTAAVANVVAGTILIYTRAFQLGDRVRIADAVGSVEEKTLLVTRIRTPKNVIVTIPNAAVVGSNIVNYSAAIRDLQVPLTIHTTITLGYDVPWRKVYQVLEAAAAVTPHILTDPAPFVLQTSLDDFYVSYELNAFTQESQRLPEIYSHLHENIQDGCNGADIEILSPHYAAVRDGHQTTIPADYLPVDYEAPGFRVQSPLSQLWHTIQTGQSPPQS